MQISDLTTIEKAGEVYHDFLVRAKVENWILGAFGKFAEASEYTDPFYSDENAPMNPHKSFKLAFLRIASCEQSLDEEQLDNIEEHTPLYQSNLKAEAAMKGIEQQAEATFKGLLRAKGLPTYYTSSASRSA